MNALQRLALLLIFIISLPACTPAPAARLAGLDPDEESGIGGTGMLVAGAGATGIIGEITGYGSIFVNGVEIEFDATTPVFQGDEVRHDHRFAIGEVVEVLASPGRNKLYLAQHINLRHEVVGAVDQVDSQARSFEVLGQEVLLGRSGLALPKPGQTLLVAGFRDSHQRIHATALTAAPASTLPAVRGLLRRDSGGALKIGKLTIEAGHLSASPGDQVQVVGEFKDGVLLARRIQPARELPFAGQANRWLVQAFVTMGPDAAPRIAATPLILAAPQLRQQLTAQPDRPLVLEIRTGRGDAPPTIFKLLEHRTLPSGRPTPLPAPPDRPRPHDTLPSKPPMLPSSMNRFPGMGSHR